MWTYPTKTIPDSVIVYKNCLNIRPLKSGHWPILNVLNGTRSPVKHIYKLKLAIQWITLSSYNHSSLEFQGMLPQQMHISLQNTRWIILTTTASLALKIARVFKYIVWRRKLNYLLKIARFQHWSKTKKKLVFQFY